MSYCNLQDLITRYGEQELIQLTDEYGTGEIDNDVVNRAISDADGDIDSRLGSRFKAPINPVPKPLNRVACQLARYYLYDDEAPDTVKEQKKDAIKLLEGVASGKNDIGITDAGEKPVSNNTVEIQSGGNVFNRKDNNFI